MPATSKTKPGRGSDQFPLRLPEGLREEIKSAAEKAGRSMNAELLERIAQFPLFQRKVHALELKVQYQTEEIARLKNEGTAAGQMDGLREVTAELASLVRTLRRG